ncbi:MAG: hypothetical protein J6U12_02900 [Candidatus Methanomethylophilaceae archaeon]|nr:hypothetical protein [Candidatus Methanomethylophilaceae archaeon]MBP5734514.1 hypothetical protein [Candidatus Methanomethylophilaceae archaeon]
MDLLISKDKAETLARLELKLSERNMSTVILFEGIGGMAMSHIVNQIIAVFEPRNIRYHSISTANMPWIKYCLLNVAPKGQISIFDRGWYSGILSEGDEKLADNITLVNSFERYLYNNGVNVIKFYLDIDEDVIKKNKKSYPVDIDGESEVFNNIGKFKDFSVTKSKIRNLLDKTNSQYSQWDVVEVADYKDTVRKIAAILESRLSELLTMPRVPERYDIMEVYPNPRENVDFSQSISKSDYNKKLAKLQNKLAELQVKLANSKKGMCLVFEGWDAAGKGGCIKRVTQALNPRGYKTFPTPAPTAEEKSHTHLWRFAKNMPDPGQITIFDRSWYGRMMVEPIEGFCTEDEYSRAGAEINLFESSLYKDHVIFLKFWIDVTKEEQLKRFNDRAADPLKNWKLTDEDWRNRKKWDVYEKYINSMIKQTNTDYAPWIDVECVDKRYGRIKVLETIVDTLKEVLDD